MHYDSVSQALEKLDKLQQTSAAYNHAMGVLYLDATTAAPSDSWEGRGKTMEVLSQLIYDLMANPENGELLSYLESEMDQLTPVQRRQVEVLRKNYDRMFKIPAQEYVAYNVLVNDAQAIWAKAKNENDFSSFLPYLEQIVDYNRKFAAYSPTSCVVQPKFF